MTALFCGPVVKVRNFELLGSVLLHRRERSCREQLWFIAVDETRYDGFIISSYDRQGKLEHVVTRLRVEPFASEAEVLETLKAAHGTETEWGMYSHPCFVPQPQQRILRTVMRKQRLTRSPLLKGILGFGDTMMYVCMALALVLSGIPGHAPRMVILWVFTPILLTLVVAASARLWAGSRTRDVERVKTS